MRLEFLGAAHTVTGSCYLLEAGEDRYLVDCGMFRQGSFFFYVHSIFISSFHQFMFL